MCKRVYLNSCGIVGWIDTKTLEGFKIFNYHYSDNAAEEVFFSQIIYLAKCWCLRVII